ncbi:MAG: EAL domain-containing protein [Pseudomonadales bacterium]|nr:EAL domain-containing protein [Pseudomonadales bacterium]
MNLVTNDMTSSWWRQLINITAPITLLAMGTWLAWMYTDQPIALALLLLAILTANLTDRRGATLLVTMIATVCLATPYLFSATLPSGSQSLWFACLWSAAALLNWDPKRGSIDVDELKRALHDAPTGLLITDLSGKIVTVNESMAKVLHKKQKELQGVRLVDLVGNSLWDLINEQTETLARGDSLDVQFELEANGQNRIFYGYGKLARDSKGKPRFYVIQVNDLTDEQAAKRALDEANSQLRSVLSHSSDVIFVLNQKLKVTFANQTASGILNREISTIVGQQFYNLIGQSDRRRLMQTLESFHRQGRREISIGTITLIGMQELSVQARVARITDASTSSYAIICTVDRAELHAREATKISEARFSQVFHRNPDAILILRASDNMVIDFNQGFTDLLGYSREDAIGDPELEKQFWVNANERLALAERMRTEKEIIGYETTFRAVNGGLLHVEIALRYIEIDGDLCLLCLGRDITKRISAEAALIETEEKFEKVFTQSPDGIIIIRQADNIITDLNDAFIERSGYIREDYIGKKFTKFLPTESQQELPELAEALNSEGMFDNREITFYSREQEPLPSLISGTVLELGGETYTMVIAKDISKQRATEERLRRSEQRFRGIFENAPIGILLVDMQGRIFQANHTAATLLAYDEQHMYGIHVSRLVPHEDRQDLKKLLEQLSLRSSPQHKSERKLCCQNGIEMWANINILLQRDRDDMPSYFIVQLADISDIKRGQERMEQMAFYDTLTNLANRRLFHDRLTHAIETCARSNRSAALLYLDLDNFKRVNDTLGHEAGDFLLREVADRLRNCVRQEDTVGRTGGDEFTILLNDITTPSDAGLVAQKILNHLREPLDLDGHPLVVTTSIGVTILPSDGKDPNILMRNADLAMYKAKERGRNNYQFYSDDLNHNAVKRLRTEYEIRQALDLDQFELFYQPKISLQTMQIVGVESLIRWNHPERGLLGPHEFIEIAEDTGSIIDIGSWVIEEACRACQTLNANSDRPIDVAINISPRQFRDPNLVTTLRRSMRELALNPANIEIEITETMLMQDVEAAEMTISRFSDLGVRLAIDDFGTGYSSLIYLKRFPINTVKVDRSFVMELPHNPDDLAITRAVVAMAHQLNMEVVAEGVETTAQLECLAAEDCEYAQGFLFSKPVPMHEVQALIAKDPALAIGG